MIPNAGSLRVYTGPQTLKFWSSYVNPGGGFLNFDVDGLAIATSEATAGPRAVVFTNGQAAISSRYDDVGLTQILVKDDTTINPELPTGIRGATGNFVVRPDRFVLSNIRDDTGTIINPQAANATDPIFIAAGAPFQVTVTAVDAEGDATPNYGLESSAESVRLDVNLFAPAGGNAPPVAAATGFGAFAGGAATGTDFTWPEVGIMQLDPGVADNDHLGR